MVVLNAFPFSYIILVNQEDIVQSLPNQMETIHRHPPVGLLLSPDFSLQTCQLSQILLYGFKDLGTTQSQNEGTHELVFSTAKS